MYTALFTVVYMNEIKVCKICNNQKIINDNHVRHIDGELVRLCPVCYEALIF